MEEHNIQNLVPDVNAGAHARKMEKPEHGNEFEKFKATLEMLLPRTTIKNISEEEKRKGVQDLEKERAAMQEVSKV